jgi:hypothetical protein
MIEENKKNQDLVSQLIDSDYLNKIHGNLVTLPELKKILKKNSASSIAHLIHTGKIKMITLLGKHFVTKEDLNIYLYDPLFEGSKENKDYELSKGMKKYLGLVDEEMLLTKQKESDSTKRQRLTDNKQKSIGPNSSILRIRIKK